MAEAYHVNYHVLQVIYSCTGFVFTGPEFARVWAGMSLFGRHRVVGGFWQRTNGNFNLGKEARFELGSLEHVEPMLNGLEPIYGGGTYSRKNLRRDAIRDCDFYFTHEDAARWEGLNTQPEFSLAVSGQWFERVGADAFLEKAKEHFELADAHGAPYGLIDVASPEDAWAGMVYGSFWMQAAPLHRWIEQGNWVYSAAKKGDRARRIYWGNYFGARVLERLGGREDFVRRYRAHARMEDKSSNAHIWEFTNGVFVSLCLDPLGCKPGAPLDWSANFNLLWLQEELGSKGVLNAWDEGGTVASVAEPAPDTMSSAATEANVAQLAPSFLELNDAEVAWISDCVTQAREFVQKYLRTIRVPMLDPAILDEAFSAWAVQWQAGSASEDPNTVVNCIGLAFGQWLVDRLDMEWTVVNDASGTDMAVRFGRPGNHVQVFPTHVVAKQLHYMEPGFLAKLFDITRAQVGRVW